MSDAPNITPHGLRRAVSRGAAAALALRAGGMALAAITAIVLARALGAAGYGTYAWVFAWVAALAVPAALGADQLLVREAGIALDRGEWSRLRSLLRSTLGWVAALSGAIVLVAGAALAIAGDGTGARRTALLVALPIIPLAALAAVAQGTLLGLGRTATALAPGTVGRQAAFLALAAVAAAAGGLSATGAVALQLAASAGAAVVALVLARRAVARLATRSGSPTGRAPAREWLRASVPMGAATMFLALDAQVGLLALGALGSAAAAGVYAAALQCTAPFVLLLVAVRLPLGAAVARLGAAGELARLQRGLRNATRGVAAVSALIATVLLVAPEAVLGLFGSEFTAGATALRIVAVASLVNALCAFNGMVLIMGGEERAAMRAAFGCLVLDAGLCVALVPPLGARGAAIAMLVSVTARNVVNSVMVRRLLGVDATVIGRVGRRPAAATRP